VLGHAGVMKILLDAGADVESGTDGVLPLNDAATLGHMGVVRVLLDAGADVAAKSGKKEATALHYAAEAGQREMARSNI